MSGGFWLTPSKRGGPCAEGRTQCVEWEESAAEGLAPSVLCTRQSWPEALRSLRERSRVRGVCLGAAVQAACAERA